MRELYFKKLENTIELIENAYNLFFDHYNIYINTLNIPSTKLRSKFECWRLLDLLYNFNSELINIHSKYTFDKDFYLDNTKFTPQTLSNFITKYRNNIK